MNQNQSVTNFDLPSLHILLEEIEVALKDAETHLSEFHEDEEQVALLLDSATVISQLASVFALIDFKGSSELAKVLGDCFQKLHDSGDNTNTELVMDISEGIMVLDRYIEFVLLKEVLEPALLVPIINKLAAHLGRPAVSVDTLVQGSSICISNPEKHYQAPKELGLPMAQLIASYRAGLGVVLAHKSGTLSDDDRQKVKALTQVCQVLAQKSDTLFWQAAFYATQNLEQALPISNDKKRILIYLEQQLQQYLPLHDRRFADLVSLAFGQNPDFAAQARNKYQLTQSNQSEQQKMQRFLFGPNREITDTLNNLIQSEIASIKEKVDSLARGDNNINAVSNTEIARQLLALGSTMRLLGLDDASQALKKAGNEVSAWQVPNSDDFDKLLNELMVAENAAIFLAKSHTPGAVKLPLHNHNISLHQLDTAYDTLIKESRINIATIAAAIEAYIADPEKQVMHLQNTTEILEQVGGSSRFLGLQNMDELCRQLGRYLEFVSTEQKQTPSDENLAAIADVLMAVDLQFEGQEQNRPVSKHATIVGQHSLNRLLQQVA